MRSGYFKICVEHPARLGLPSPPIRTGCHADGQIQKSPSFERLGAATDDHLAAQVQQTIDQHGRHFYILGRKACAVLYGRQRPERVSLVINLWRAHWTSKG